jgi:hypothetical protein
MVIGCPSFGEGRPTARERQKRDANNDAVRMFGQNI